MNTVVSQALAVGVPVITTRHSGLPEQVIDGTNGFLVAEGDYVALAERILTIADHPDLLPRLTQQLDARAAPMTRILAPTLHKCAETGIPSSL